MALLVNTFFEERVRDLFSLAARVDEAFSAAGLEYRVAGWLCTSIWKRRRRTPGG